METQMEVSVEGLRQEILEQYNGDSVEEISTDGSKYAISDYRSENGFVYIYKNIKGLWKEPTVLFADPVKAENGFGMDIHFSENGEYLAVMSESATNFTGKKIEYPVSIFKLLRDNRYTRLSFVYPRFHEKDSRYGSAMFLNKDGQTLFVSAECKTNDETTICPGSTGGVYVYTYDAMKKIHIQKALIRPPLPGITGFGYTIDCDDDLIIEDENGRLFLFYFEGDSWVFEKEIFD